MDAGAFAKVLRERAEEFRRVAEAISEEHTRKGFLDLARSYSELAEAEEVMAALLDPHYRPIGTLGTHWPWAQLPRRLGSRRTRL